jgi:hypothetical protein
LIQAFRYALLNGSRQALRLRLLLPLYVCSLLLGLAQIWPLGMAAAGGALHNPFLGDLASGSGDTLANLFFGSPAAPAAAGLWVLALLPLTALFGLVYNFFSGGILGVWTETRPFWAGCRRTFWAFTGLGILLIVLAALVLVAAVLLGRFVGIVAGLVGGFVLLQIVNLLGEYARALAVARERRNPFVLLGLAIAFCARRAGGVLLLGLLGLLLQLLVAGLYAVVAGLLGASPLLVVWQQLVLLAALTVKLLRLAWAASYTQPSPLSPLPLRRERGAEQREAG